MNLLDFSPYIALVLAAIALLTQVKGILSSGEKKLEERTKEAERKLIDLDRRVQAVENEMKHFPDRATTHRLELALTEISGRLNTLDERLKPIGATNHRLQEFLLEQAQHSKVA